MQPLGAAMKRVMLKHTHPGEGEDADPPEKKWDDLIGLPLTADLEARLQAARARRGKLLNRPDDDAPADDQPPARKAALGFGMRVVDHEIGLLERDLEMAHRRDARRAELGLPADCRCLGRGGWERRAFGVGPVERTGSREPTAAAVAAVMEGTIVALDDDGEVVMLCGQYCGCPAGTALHHAEDELREKLTQHHAHAAATSKAERLWEGSGLPDGPAWRTITLDSYPQDSPARCKTVRLVRAWDAHRRAKGRWLYLHGKSRRGKTGLTVALGRQWLDQGLGVQFRDASSLCDRLRAANAPDATETVDDLIAALVGVDVLVLDDLGVQRSTDFVLEALFRILNGRKNVGRTTVVTSNFALPDLAQQLVGHEPSRQVAAGRIQARLDELCDRIDVLGEPLGGEQQSTLEEEADLPW